MSSVYYAGKIFIRGNRVSWILKDFNHSYPQELNTQIHSPHFYILERQWWLSLFPNGLSSYDTEGWLGIRLFNLTDDRQFRVRVGLVGRSGEDMMSSSAMLQDATAYSHSAPKFIQRSVFDSKKKELLPGGNLELFCKILPIEGSAAIPDGRVGIQEEEEQSKAGDSKNSEVSTQTENYFAGEHAFDIAGVEVSTQTEVKICYFRNLLGGRSRMLMLFLAIFAALISSLFFMVEPDMKDNSTDLVSNEDFDRDTSDFLRYLCTEGEGRVNSRNVLNLLTVADKYPVKDLKNVCLKFMTDKICIDNFCDMLTLSLRHRETELTDAVTRFFMNNAKGIMETAKWQAFLTENPILGNELLIKYFKSIRKAKNPG